MSGLILPPGARSTKPITLDDVIKKEAPQPTRLGVGMTQDFNVVLTIPGFGHITLPAATARKYGQQIVACSRDAEERYEAALKDETSASDPAKARE